MFPIRRPLDEDGESGWACDRDEGRFLRGRAGDHFVIVFQCDLCHFRNIQRREPRAGSGADSVLMRNIRRANLDAMWSREPTTITQNRYQLDQFLKKGVVLGLKGDQIFAPFGPMPLEDRDGLAAACCLLERSLDSGKNEATIQYDTVRKMRGSLHNQWRSSVHSSGMSVAVRGKGKLTASKSPSDALWFERFMEGLHKRMGDYNLPDLAVSIEVMLKLDSYYEEEFQHLTIAGADPGKVIFPAGFAILSYVGGLRGEETPLFDLEGSVEHYESARLHPKHPHLVMALRGRFKTETGELVHLKPLVRVTSSGLRVGVWFDRILSWHESRGHTRGPAFRDSRGKRCPPSHYAQSIMDMLTKIQKQHPDLISEKTNVPEEFGVGRSFRRGATSRARAAGLSEETIVLNNRWSTVESGRGRKPGFAMASHYTDVRLVLGPLLAFSKAL